MKRNSFLFFAVPFLVVAVSSWAGGKQEVQIAGPPYDVETVKEILASDALYQQGYLQQEMDKNGDGVNDETGNRIYAGALKDFRDANGDGLDDATGGELPLGLRNRLLDQNGDGVVDGTEEPVGQYVNRVRTEAQLRYEQGDAEGDQLQTQTQTRTRDQSKDQIKTQTKSQTKSATQSGSGGSTSAGQSKNVGPKGQ